MIVAMLAFRSAEVLAVEQDVSGIEQVTQNLSQAVSRIYLYGLCNEALHKIFKRDAEIKEAKGSVHP